MSRRRVGVLSERDREVLGFVSVVGIAGARQIERVVFPAAVGGSALSAARRCRRVLLRLSDDGYLNRLDRRIGGVRSGSAGHLYSLATLGRRALGLSGKAHSWQPGSRFVEHAVAAAELHVELVEAERRREVADLRIVHEPSTWRRFTSATGLLTLKPDLLIELTVPPQPGEDDPADSDSGGWELRWFVEIDRSTEHLPTVLRKCDAYQQYWRSGQEAAVHDVFPRVLWSVPDQRRLKAIEGAIGRSRTLHRDLFVVTTADEVAAVLGQIEVPNQSRRGGEE